MACVPYATAHSAQVGFCMARTYKKWWYVCEPKGRVGGWCPKPADWCKDKGQTNQPQYCVGRPGHFCSSITGETGFKPCVGEAPKGTGWPNGACRAWCDEPLVCTRGGYTIQAMHCGGLPGHFCSDIHKQNYLVFTLAMATRPKALRGRTGHAFPTTTATTQIIKN